MTLKLFILSGLLLAALVLLSGCKLTRAGYESAPYKVIEKDGAFEIREYPDLRVVSTPMETRAPADDNSFMRLFRYISGANESGSKIAMTTPVFTDQAGSERKMSFVVPRDVAAGTVPKASHELVAVATRPGGRFAVIRFSGGRDENRTSKARQQLADWMTSRQIKTTGSPEMASYDPPFIPPFLKRNEILLRIESR